MRAMVSAALLFQYFSDSYACTGISGYSLPPPAPPTSRIVDQWITWGTRATGDGARLFCDHPV